MINIIQLKCAFIGNYIYSTNASSTLTCIPPAMDYHQKDCKIFLIIINNKYKQEIEIVCPKSRMIRKLFLHEKTRQKENQKEPPDQGAALFSTGALFSLI